MSVRAKASVSEKKRMAMTEMAQIDMKAPRDVACKSCCDCCNGDIVST